MFYVNGFLWFYRCFFGFMGFQRVLFLKDFMGFLGFHRILVEVL